MINKGVCKIKKNQCLNNIKYPKIIKLKNCYYTDNKYKNKRLKIQKQISKDLTVIIKINLKNTAIKEEKK